MDHHVGRLRWWIAVILAGSTALNYLDRQTLSILIGTIQRELRITDVQYSYITVTFLASYTACTALYGRVLDWVGTRKGLSVAVAIWSAASALHPLCRTGFQFASVRFLLGAGESANFPAGVKGVAEWFPLKERAFATGIFNSGSSFGAALGAPLIAFAALAFGWRWAFVTTGLLGFLWLAIFLSVYRKPLQRNESGLQRGLAESGVSVCDVLLLPRAWGCFVARIFIDPVTYFLIFWVPKYLQNEHDFSLADIGRFLWAPYLALALGTLVGGYIPALLVNAGWTVNAARKMMMALSSTIIAACAVVIVTTHSGAVALFALGLFMFCHGAWGNIAIPAEVFPDRLVGTVAGIGGMLGGVAGIIGQLLIGRSVQHASFTPVFLVAGSLYFVAFTFLCFLIPNLGSFLEGSRAHPPEIPQRANIIS